MKKTHILLLVLLPLIHIFSVQSSKARIEIVRFTHDKTYNNLSLFFRIVDEQGYPVVSPSKKQLSVKFNNGKIPYNFKTMTGSNKISATGVSTILIVDASGSVNTFTRNEITQACRSFISQMRKEDETAIFLFNNFVIRLQNLTSNKEELYKALTKYRTGGTLSKINNAIYQSLEYLNQIGKNEKKVLIVISDGLDEGSTKNSDEIIELANKLKIPIYSMGYTNINSKFFEHLKNLSKNTNGQFSLKNSKQLAKQILAYEKSVIKINFSPDMVKKHNVIEVNYTPLNLLNKYKFKIPDQIINDIIKNKKRKTLFIALAFGAVFIILVVIVIILIKKNRKPLINSEEAKLISKLINDDAIDIPQKIKNIYLNAINNKELERENFLFFSKRIKKLCKEYENELKPGNSQNVILLDSINKKLTHLENKGLQTYKTNYFFIEPYKTQIVYLIEGRVANISEYSQKAFSKIILADINKRLDETSEIPLTLSEVDHYRSLLTKSSYTETEINSFIADIKKSMDIVDNETQANAEIGINNLSKLLDQGRRKYKLGNMVIPPYLSQIQEKLKLCEHKLNKLVPEEKKALTKLALKDIQEHEGEIDIYEKIISSKKIDKNAIEALYKRLSSELMYCEIEEKERTIDCSALYKISMAKDCSDNGCDKEDIFGKQGYKQLEAYINEINSKEIDEEVETELNDLIEIFSNDTEDYLNQNKNVFYDTGGEIEIDNIVENFLFKSFSAGIEGFDINRVFQDISSYDDETLAKLMPYMIQVVKDSHGTEKEANLGILKNLAMNLNINIPEMSDVNQWDDWWKKNKSGVLNEIAKLDETELEKKSAFGFYIHEDIICYRLKNEKIFELQGRILNINANEITLLIYDLLDLEEIIAIYSRVDDGDIFIKSTYSFLRCMWIAEIEENMYEAGVVFVMENESHDAENIIEKLAGE